MSDPLFRRIDNLLAKVHRAGLYDRHPYDLNSIASIIVADSSIDEVEFHSFQKRPNKNGLIEGFFKLIPIEIGIYTESSMLARIFIRSDLEPEWSRLVACKELCHILWQDLPSSRASTQEQLLNQVEHILSENPFDDSQKICIQGLIEDSALVAAIELLVPIEFRLLLVENYQNRKVKLSDISERFGVPEAVISLVFQEDYMKFTSKGRRHFFKEATFEGMGKRISHTSR
ncbi:hypothetical protein [Skermanella aerolata]|uniref:hypothetical protein n=1 Tax=Skermanella aerolata TaxID=393310 RepID=UPI0011BD7191|nr:hypothetical protein [Skermanella aerolata]